MTSAERDEENMYNAGDVKAKEPEYSTLSYTWGRWRISGQDVNKHPALPVKGTPWAIPPISNGHFTVEAFQNAINRIAESSGVSWVWVDIGCIDQRRDDPKSQFVNTQGPIEIGRQASIFKQAKSTFVWLCRLESTKLSAVVDGVQQYGLDFSGYIWGRNRGKRIPDSLMEGLAKAFDYIFDDPWFSSLWTLQEIVLRNDALVLSTEGEPVLWNREPSEEYMYLTIFINFCKNTYREMEKALASKKMATMPSVVSDQATLMINHIQQQILQAGFYYLFSTNPNVQYGIARYRTTTRKEDRIYAIMQIYNLTVGKSVRPEENPKLEELIFEFAGAICQRSPILGQYFVHTQVPRDGTTWQITEQSSIPDALMMYHDPVDLATITPHRGGLAIAAGKCCRFPALLKASYDDGKRHPSDAVNGMGLNTKIFFDYHIDFIFPFLTRISKDMQPHQGARKPQMNYNKVLVLHLGHLRGGAKRGNQGFYQKHVGLLLYPTNRAHGGVWEGVTFERLGVCTWSHGQSSDLLEKIEWQGVDQMVLE